MSLLKSLRALRERPAWVLVHRWVGLAMAGFLVVAGLTGSLLAFYPELDAAMNPQLQVQAPYAGAPMLDAVTLLERAYAARPEIMADSAIAPYRENAPLLMWVWARNPKGPPVDGELYLDPYTGEVLGSRNWGDLRQGRTNLMPFIYALHYSLALGDIGTLLFGIIAILWTLDCFVGFYLTLPRGRPFLQKWKPAWWIAPKRLNYDLHRAFSLWTWVMLFVLAWSSVALNLPMVYRPVMELFFSFSEDDHHHDEGQADGPPEPPMGWRAGYLRGQELMGEAMAQHGVGAHREDALRYDHHEVRFNYWVATKFKDGGDPYDWFGVSFDARNGELREIHLEDLAPGRQPAGDFLTRWLVDLHMAKVWGLPYRIFVCLMGLVVTMLSVTGVIIWWRKRRGRVGRKKT